MSGYLKRKLFKEINLNDVFFDSLKADYAEFETWFRNKCDEEAYVLYNGQEIYGFLYIKNEEGPITDVEPKIECKRALKVGTLKINPHGTRLGERFIKKALDHAIISKAELCYVTVFEKHTALIELFAKYGFKIHGKKNTKNGQELVLVKSLVIFQKEVLIDYPLVLPSSSNKYMLAIRPEYHTNMFPDSILNNETFDILEDVSHTNSIHKIYVCSMPVNLAKRGDIVVIYRTNDHKGPAEYRSVATSICVVEEVKSKYDFDNFDDFYEYTNSYSVFDRVKLYEWYNKHKCFTIKMTYNAALTKRLTRQKLADVVGLERNERWGFIQLSEEQFYKIVELGEISEGIIIN